MFPPSALSTPSYVTAAILVSELSLQNWLVASHSSTVSSIDELSAAKLRTLGNLGPKVRVKGKNYSSSR